MDITKTDHHNGTSTWTFADGTSQIRCNDCNQWHHAGTGSLRHSKRCATPTAQYQPVPAVTTPTVPHPRSANGLASDELLAAVQRGYLTTNEAMNTDF